MINIDQKNYEYTSIERDAFLAKQLGKPIVNEAIDDILAGDWLMPHVDEVRAEIERMTGREYAATDVFNTYNDENDFDSEFQFVVFYPADDGDYLYANDVYVAIEPHNGGDVRGNYGKTELYGPIDDLADAGFFDWLVGWNVSDLNGETLDGENDQACIGYAQNPTCHLAKLFVTRSNDWEVVTRYSEKLGGFMARTLTGKTAVLTPYTNAEYGRL